MIITYNLSFLIVKIACLELKVPGKAPKMQCDSFWFCVKTAPKFKTVMICKGCV